MQSGLAVFLMLLVLWSCSPAHRQAGEQAENKTLVRVDNRNYNDMTIYVLRGGERVRLGLVNGNSKQVFVIPEYLLTGVNSLRFLADPIGGRETPMSQEMAVTPGEEVELIITN